MMTITQTLTRTASALFVVASLAAVPALAQEPAAGAAMQGPAMSQKQNGLEPRISELHQQLKITPDQEKKWDAVAKVMRSNAESSRAQVMEKRKDEANMTAVADLNAYADISELHAKNTRKMAKVFSTLYDSMSADQKKAADEVFREHKRKSNADDSDK